MNFDRSLIFSYLEEDNIQRAYFRVRPLLTLEGDVRQEAIQLWPNEGGLRIVPDRNEQHTFKTRMRGLGAYCVVDLRNQPPEAGKIRTNKNFRPDRGEVNQYILYSDTVHSLPENTFYQMLDGSAADYTAMAEKAITPLFYIREGDTIYGPVKKETPIQPKPAEEAAGMLFEIPCPDGTTRMILCMDDTPVKAEMKAEADKASAAASAPQIDAPVSCVPKEEAVPATETEEKKDDVLPIGEALQILDVSKTTEDTIRQLDQPVSASANLLRQREESTAAPLPIQPTGTLSGTPLIRTPLHVSVQQNKNRTQEIVSSQWSVGKYEPPTQNLPVSAAMRSVQNPVEAACAHLREAWNASSAHDQLTDFMLSLDGVRSQLEAKLCNGNHVTILQRVLRERLQDLEAERLAALCELDKARRDVDAYKQELINGLSARIARETGKLESSRCEAEARLATLKAEINGLMLQRDALLAKVDELQGNVLPETVAKLFADAHMTAPIDGIPLRMSPVSGQTADGEQIIQRLLNICHSSGLDISRNAAIAILVLLAGSSRIGIACSTPAPVATLLKNIASAMGWNSSYAHQFAAEQRPAVGIRPVDGTPAILTTSLPSYAPLHGVTKLTLSRSVSNLIRNAAYDVHQWPVFLLPALTFVPEMESSDASPVSAASIDSFAAAESVSYEELNAVLSPILNAAIPLSGATRKELYHFISVCAGKMEGGLPVAIDWGVMLWIIPALERGSKHYNAVKALLDEYPLSLAKM